MRLKNVPGAREVIAASDFVVQEPETLRGNWIKEFGNDNPLELEIGIGKGRFLMELAERHPERNYLGIEMYSSVLLRAIQKAEQRTAGLETPIPVSILQRPQRPAECNFRLLRFDATGLPSLFEKGEVSRIYLNFSDPWPKDRHADRRLTSGRFLARYEEVLPHGGGLVFKTDNRGLFEYSLEQIRESGWTLQFHTTDLHGTEGEYHTVSGAESILTEYEEKFVAEGKPICMLEAVCP